MTHPTKRILALLLPDKNRDSRQICGRSLLDCHVIITIWTVHYSSYHVSVDRVGAINNIHRYGTRPVGHASVDIVYDASERSYVED